MNGQPPSYEESQAAHQQQQTPPHEPMVPYDLLAAVSRNLQDIMHHQLQLQILRLKGQIIVLEEERLRLTRNFPNTNLPPGLTNIQELQQDYDRLYDALRQNKATLTQQSNDNARQATLHLRD